MNARLLLENTIIIVFAAIFFVARITNFTPFVARFASSFPSFPFDPLAASQSYIQLITTAIDAAVVAVILVSVALTLCTIIIRDLSHIFFLKIIRGVASKSKTTTTTTTAAGKYTVKNGAVAANQKGAAESPPPKKNRTGGTLLATHPLIQGLLFALELESASAILKAGVFTSTLVIRDGGSGLVNNNYNFTFAANPSLYNNFLFFVGIVSLRIAINYSLQKHSRRNG